MSVPTVLLAVLAKQKELTLPLYLQCIDRLEYPKDRIVLWVRTNNSTDRTREILAEWIARVGAQYSAVEFDDTDVPEKVERFDVHEWNEERFSVLGRIRQASLRAAWEYRCDYYFVVDCDNYITPDTLTRLIALDLPIVAPMLINVDANQNLYSNYHFHVDRNGYYLPSPEYDMLVTRRIRGVVEVGVVHCTYLVRSVIPDLTYDDGSGRYEYVIFSDSARRAGVPQMLDNRKFYGCLTLREDPDLVESARIMMSGIL